MTGISLTPMGKAAKPKLARVCDACPKGLCGINAMAQRFEPAKLIFTDGKTLVGLAKSPKQAYDKTINFKATENGDKQTFQSEQLKTIILYSDKDTIELERVKH